MKTRHRISLVTVHLTTLEENLKQQLVFQDNPKDILTDSGLDSELVIPLAPNCDPLDPLTLVLNNHISVYSCIRQNEIVTNSISI